MAPSLRGCSSVTSRIRCLVQAAKQFLVTSCDTPILASLFAISAAAAGVVGGVAEAAFQLLSLPSELQNWTSYSHLCQVHIWLGVWFAGAVAMSLALFRTAWARLLASIIVSPLIFALASSLKPEHLSFELSTRLFYCTRGCSLESWNAFHLKLRLEWVRMAVWGVTLFTLAHQTGFRLFLVGRRAHAAWIFPACGVLSGLLLRFGSEMGLDVSLEDRDSPTFILTPFSPTGLAQGGAQLLGFLVACACADRGLSKVSGGGRGGSQGSVLP